MIDRHCSTRALRCARGSLSLAEWRVLATTHGETIEQRLLYGNDVVVVVVSACRDVGDLLKLSVVPCVSNEALMWCRTRCCGSRYICSGFGAGRRCAGRSLCQTIVQSCVGPVIASRCIYINHGQMCIHRPVGVKNLFLEQSDRVRASKHTRDHA